MAVARAGIVFARVFVVALVLAGCQQLIGDYSLEAYKNATMLKAETAALVDKSSQPFASVVKDVDAHTTKLNAAYEYSAGLPNNQLSSQQWKILIDPNGGLYGEFLNNWRTNRTTKPFYREEKKKQLNRAFDEIICLEANKQESKKCS